MLSTSEYCSHMRTLLFALFFVMWLGVAHAEIAYARVLEYWVDISPHVGVYQFESAAPHPQSEDHVQFLLHNYPGSPRSDYELREVRAKLVRSLRGTPPATLSVVCSAYTKFPGSMPLKFDAEDQFLVFWSETATHELTRVNVISLTKPPPNRNKPLASDGLSPALRPDFTVLKDGKLIEQVVKERIAAKPQARRPPAGSHDDNVARVEIPDMTEAYNAIYNGSVCYLIIPKDLVQIGQNVVPDGFRVREGISAPETGEEEEVVLPLNVPAPNAK